MKIHAGLLASLTLACTFFAPPAHAYFEYAPNRNLQEEVESHAFRILPRSAQYSLAIDGDFFKPVLIGERNYEYYHYDTNHGNGYWLDLRSEIKPVQNLVLNLKATLTQGTTSNGPTYIAVVVPRAGLTYRVRNFLGMDWETRLSDIDRQTVGTGLFVEMKETAGGYIQATRGDFDARIMVDGTGSFGLDGGLIDFEPRFKNGLIGASVLIQEVDIDAHPPQVTGTIYSKHEFEGGLGYGVEWGVNPRSNAGLAYLTWNAEGEHWKVGLKPQFRYYGKSIMGDYARNFNHNYISYDQNDKPFTSFLDILSQGGDHVETYSGQVNLEYRFNRFYRIYAENELFDYRYHDSPEVSGIFFRAGLRFFPFHEREDEFGILVGNKYLISSTSLAPNDPTSRTYLLPNQPDFELKSLFKQINYWMIHYSIKM